MATLQAQDSPVFVFTSTMQLGLSLWGPQHPVAMDGERRLSALPLSGNDAVMGAENVTDVQLTQDAKLFPSTTHYKRQPVPC